LKLERDESFCHKKKQENFLDLSEPLPPPSFVLDEKHFPHQRLIEIKIINKEG